MKLRLAAFRLQVAALEARLILAAWAGRLPVTVPDRGRRLSLRSWAHAQEGRRWWRVASRPWATLAGGAAEAARRIRWAWRLLRHGTQYFPDPVRRR